MSRHWKNLTVGQRRLVIALAATPLTLAGIAWTDLALRPADVINGRKRLWAWLIAVNFVGPIAYLRWGRREEPRPPLGSADR
jgi:hypothetical protein